MRKAEVGPAFVLNERDYVAARMRKAETVRAGEFFDLGFGNVDCGLFKQISLLSLQIRI